MVDTQPVDDTKYAGPSKAIEVLGRGNAYGWIGSFVGLFVGGAGAAIGTNVPGKWTEKATSLLNDVGIKLNGRWPLIAGGAFVGWQALHMVGMVIGLRVGAARAGEGHAQFERVKAKCDGLKAQLDLLRDSNRQQAEEIALLKQSARLHAVEAHDASPDVAAEAATPEPVPVVHNAVHEARLTPAPQAKSAAVS